MKEIIEKCNFEISKEAVDFIDENENPELAKRIFKVVVTEVVDEKGEGNVNQTFVALAATVCQFFKLAVKTAKRDGAEFTCKEFSDNFHKILEAYSLVADLEEEINRKNEGHDTGASN